MPQKTPYSLRIDGAQYCNYSKKIFQEINQAALAAIFVTVAYHENFRELVTNLIKWQNFFKKYPKWIFNGTSAKDIEFAYKNKKTAVFFVLQNPSPIEDDWGLVEIIYKLGIRFMQLSYNNQSLLATGCYENTDNGITKMGKQIINEMNRLGLIVDMSHSGELSTLQAIELSQTPIVISHANPFAWHSALRNKSNKVLKELANSGGILGLSLYPYHLKNNSSCSLSSFCEAVAMAVDLMGIKNVAIGSDLCQEQPSSILHWMRNGRWSKDTNYGESSSNKETFPNQPSWFSNAKDFSKLEAGFKKFGFSKFEIEAIIGKNWLNFCKKFLIL